jgi:hypothetical protein
VTWLKPLKSARTGLVLCLAGSALGAGEPTCAEGKFELSVHDGLVNLTVGEPVPVKDVVDRLAILFSTTVEGDSGSATVGPLRRDRMSIAEALSLIVQGRSFMIEESGQTGKIRRIVLARGEENHDRTQSSVTRVDTVRAPEPLPVDATKLRDIVKLSYRRDQTSLNALKEIVRNKGETSVRAAAVRALASYADLGVVSFLRARLVTDPDPRVRLAAGEAIAQANTAQSLSIIARAAVSEKDDRVRRRLQAIVDMDADHGSDQIDDWSPSQAEEQ